ncbi:putative F-box domain-containing protein [Helianthus annuus]|nr:putative F-box domain-containing protein [Helianthus annuus]
MSDNIPVEIQVEIMKRLPVRSLIQFRTVSKTWKSMIDSSAFVADYSTQMQHILIRVSVTPPRVEEHGYYWIIGCSHGLFCLYQIGRKFLVNGMGKAALWNPTIRKTVEFVVPNVANGETYETVLGFGVCHETNEPTIVKITHIVTWTDMETASCIPWQVEVFTLSTGDWRSVGGNIPCKLVSFQFDPPDGFCSVSIDGVIYWLATNRNTMDGGSCNLIISYDITSEVFGEVNLPNRLAHSPSRHWLSLFKLRESLVVFDNVCEQDRIAYDVWMMEGGVSRLFTKVSTFSYNTEDCMTATGFRKSGEHITEIVGGNRGHLVAYEPNSKNIDILGIVGMFCIFHVHPYIETLSLLDQPTTHNEHETQIKETDDRTMGSGS